jgi:hypothetical protein
MKVIDLKDAPELDPKKFVIGPLKWRSLGLSETTVNTWATACWIDNSLHLVSDDGNYERFKLKEDKMVRVGQLAGFPDPSAICQGRDRLWLLSESKTGSVDAAEIKWNANDELSKSQRNLGKISMDQAAIQVLGVQRKAK